jgi:signal transduction histidine kinase
MADEAADVPGHNTVGRVLVVDDDELMCRRLARGLATAGHAVVTAFDGGQVARQCRETPPDVLIIDIMMPTSGLEVIREIKRAYGTSVLVIGISARDDEAFRDSIFDAGANDFLAKPFPLPELVRRVNAALRIQREYIAVRIAKENADRRLSYASEASALLAHDLNNTLTASFANLQYISEEVRAEGDLAEAMESTMQSLHRMSSLVANFVDIARFEDAGLKPIVARTDVRALVEQVIGVHKGIAKLGVTFEVVCEPPDLDAKLDSSLIERVLHNLVGNAARFCNAGGRITIRAALQADAGSCTIAVTNTGPLVPATDAAHLFEKYFTGQGGKRGMGLYFCRLVAEAHGGSIAYESTDVGPRFTISLPGRD